MKKAITSLLHKGSGVASALEKKVLATGTSAVAAVSSGLTGAIAGVSAAVTSLSSEEGAHSKVIPDLSPTLKKGADKLRSAGSSVASTLDKGLNTGISVTSAVASSLSQHSSEGAHPKDNPDLSFSSKDDGHSFVHDSPPPFIPPSFEEASPEKAAIPFKDVENEFFSAGPPSYAPAFLAAYAARPSSHPPQISGFSEGTLPYAKVSPPVSASTTKAMEAEKESFWGSPLYEPSTSSFPATPPAPPQSAPSPPPPPSSRTPPHYKLLKSLKGKGDSKDWLDWAFPLEVDTAGVAAPAPPAPNPPSPPPLQTHVSSRKGVAFVIPPTSGLDAKRPPPPPPPPFLLSKISLSLFIYLYSLKVVKNTHTFSPPPLLPASLPPICGPKKRLPSGPNVVIHLV